MAALAPLTVGPFVGQNDTLNLSAQDGQRAALIQNMYSPAAAVGGDLIGRPGFTRYDFSAYAGTGTAGNDGGGVFLGIGTAFTTEVSVGDLITQSDGTKFIATAITDNTHITASASPATGPFSFTITPAGCVGGQIFGEFLYKNTDGTKRNYLIVSTTSTLIDGATAGAYRFLNAANLRLRLVEWDSTKTTFQALVNRTSVSMNGVALSTLKRLYGTTFANYLILSDGVNRIRKINASFVLSNCTDANYAFQGPLTVYYGKLMGIDASNQITERWSEENDPDTGYGTGTSDNSWDLRQTSADGLQVNIGTNDALYCGRQSSWAIITGAANSDFRSSGTVDAIQNIGCLSPDAVIVVNASVVFLDQYGRPGRIQPGYGYVPLWKRIQETLRGIGQTAALHMAAWCRYDPIKNTVQFAYRTTGTSTTNDLMLVYDADSWECLGVHTIYATSVYAVADHAYGCVFLDANLSQRLTVASGTTADCAFYVQQTEDIPANSALEVTNGGSIPVLVKVRSPKVGGDVIQEKSFDRFVVGMRNVGGTTAGVPRWMSAPMGPYDTAYPTPKSMLIGGTQGIPTSATFAGACLKSEQQGVNINGRYLQIEFTNDTSDALLTESGFEIDTEAGAEISAESSLANRPTFDTLTVFGTLNDSDFSRR